MAMLIMLLIHQKNWRNEAKAKSGDKTVQSHTCNMIIALRMQMRNSFTLNADETKKLLSEGTRHVIRIKIDPENETVSFNDMIRGEVNFNTITG